MNKFDPPSSSIHVIARGLLFQNGKIILCQAKGAAHHYLPGGHIENGEPAAVALVRELNEEIGLGDYVVKDFIGICENVYELKPELFQHEINFAFLVEVPSDLKIQSQEDHIQFSIIDPKEFSGANILPKPLKEGIAEWLESKKAFLKSF